MRCLLLVPVLAASLAAQDLTPKAKKQTRAVFLYNGTIHTVSGPTVARGGLLFAKGKIVSLHGRDERPRLPAGIRSINLKGKHVYPGLVTAQTSLGLAEIGAVPISISPETTAPGTWLPL